MAAALDLLGMISHAPAIVSATTTVSAA
jgi:hypothetical protein